MFRSRCFRHALLCALGWPLGRGATPTPTGSCQGISDASALVQASVDLRGHQETSTDKESHGLPQVLLEHFQNIGSEFLFRAAEAGAPVKLEGWPAAPKKKLAMNIKRVESERGTDVTTSFDHGCSKKRRGEEDCEFEFGDQINFTMALEMRRPLEQGSKMIFEVTPKMVGEPNMIMSAALQPMMQPAKLECTCGGTCIGNYLGLTTEAPMVHCGSALDSLKGLENRNYRIQLPSEQTIPLINSLPEIHIEGAAKALHADGSLAATVAFNADVK